MPESSRRDEYLLLSRGQWDPGKSSEEIQSAIDRFYIWYERLVAQGTFKRGHRLAKHKSQQRQAGQGAPHCGASESRQVHGFPISWGQSTSLARVV